MATVCYQLDTRREKKDGTYPIKLYIRHKSRILISTDFCATPRMWTGTEYSKEAKSYKAKNSGDTQSYKSRGNAYRYVG